MIYHIVTTTDWVDQQKNPAYEAASLQTEGFIHLSRKEQVAGVLERYYQGVSDLLLLHIDPTKLIAELRYEAATNNELFPHLYGPVNREAIVEIEYLS